MSAQNRIVLLRLALGTGLFVTYVITADRLPVYAIPVFLLFLILLQLTAYFAEQGAVRALLILGSLALLFLLAFPHPVLFPVLTVFWLYEIMQREPVYRLIPYGLLYLAGTGFGIAGGTFSPDVRDVLFLIAVISLLIALRILRDRNRRLDERILALTKSTRNLELEQKRTQLHMEQLRELYTLEERNRISRDLHDSVGHTLSAIRIQLEAIATMAESDGKKADIMARKLAAFTEEGLQRLRHLLHEMKPPRYSDQALTMRLMRTAEEFASMAGMQVNVTASRYLYRTTHAQDQLLLYALQEFLSNASRHGRASQVNVHLQYTESGLTLTMKDNGVGSDGFTKNIGIRGVEERTRAENGTVTIRTAPGEGFTTQITLPKGDAHD